VVRFLWEFEMKLSAQFSDDMKYRYLLTRYWSPQIDPLVWIMLNPSIADASRDDPTVKRCVEFSINSGFGGCVILNLFALRSTYPGNLLRDADPVGPENDGYLKYWTGKKLKVVCAWGCLHKKLLYRPIEVLKMLEGSDLRCLRLTKFHREPHHPLYLPSRLRPVKMDWEHMVNVYELRMSDV
jgi:hypothetical protein